MISCRPNNIGLVRIISNDPTNKKLTRNCFTDLRKTGHEHGEWFHLARIRRQWRAIVNTVLNFSGPIKGGEVLEKRLSASLERLSSKYLMKNDHFIR
jgi:hypothetical protein